MLTLGNVQENLTLRSLTRIGVHEALVLVLRLLYDLVAGHGVDGKFFIQNNTYTEKYWFEITDCGKNSLPLREDYN